MIFKDYYRILGLSTNKVNTDQIKIAFREQAKLYHPDVNIGSKTAEERFKDINEAYRVLSDASAKRKYDRMWNTHIGKKKNIKYEESKRNPESVVSDFFQMFFGNAKNKEEQEIKNKKNNNKKIPVKGDNVETEINVSIEEAFYGLEKKLVLRTVEGKMKSFSVKVPAGIRNNEKIRLIGQGKPGKNGGKNGDLFIRIHIEDNNRFRLKGYDIYTDLYLTPWEAALGTRATVYSINETASVYIPQCIETGERIKIQGKGYKDGKGGRGDLIAEIKIMVPKQITEQEKELFTKMKEISKFNPRKIYE